MSEFRLQDEDLAVNLELSHDRACDLRKAGCEADFRVLAARALRRARAAEIVAAWMCEELSEGQAATLLGWGNDPAILDTLRVTDVLVSDAIELPSNCTIQTLRDIKEVSR